LEECLELWTWLREHPGRVKHEWPGWDKIVDEQGNHCPACNYAVAMFVSQISDAERSSLRPDLIPTACVYCPIKWPVDKIQPAAFNANWSVDCERYGSPYVKWRQYRYEFDKEKLIEAIDEMLNLIRKHLALEVELQTIASSQQV
jgi:hypothetical protein